MLLHGENKTINFKLPNGIHKLKFKNADNESYDTINLTVNGNTKVDYKISCHTDEIKIRELSVEYIDKTDQEPSQENVDTE